LTEAINAESWPRCDEPESGAEAKLSFIHPHKTMANIDERLPENVPGRYYVDSTCIDCDQCRTLAPALFSRNSETGLSFIQRQPTAPDEIALVEEILSTCATGSIGDDGG